MKYLIETDDFYEAQTLNTIAHFMDSNCDNLVETISAAWSVFGVLAVHLAEEKFPELSKGIREQMEDADIEELDNNLRYIIHTMERLRMLSAEYRKE